MAGASSSSDKVASLVAMGFCEADAADALQQSMNESVHFAAERLIAAAARDAARDAARAQAAAADAAAAAAAAAASAVDQRRGREASQLPSTSSVDHPLQSSALQSSALQSSALPQKVPSLPSRKLPQKRHRQAEESAGGVVSVLCFACRRTSDTTKQVPPLTLTPPAPAPSLHSPSLNAPSLPLPPSITPSPNPLPHPPPPSSPPPPPPYPNRAPSVDSSDAHAHPSLLRRRLRIRTRSMRRSCPRRPRRPPQQSSSAQSADGQWRRRSLPLVAVAAACSLTLSRSDRTNGSPPSRTFRSASRSTRRVSSCEHRASSVGSPRPPTATDSRGFASGLPSCDVRARGALWVRTTLPTSRPHAPCVT